MKIQVSKLNQYLLRTQILLLGAWLFSGGWSLALGASITVQIAPRFNGAPLAFDALTNKTAAGQNISVTRLDFLMSDFALRQTDGTWIEKTNWFGYIKAGEGKNSFALENIPNGNFDRIRFHIGLPSAINHADAAQWPAKHPLNPTVDGLYWGWAGGYVFLAIEGAWNDGHKQSGYSYHLANDPQLMTVELSVALNLNSDREIQLALDMDKIFSAPNRIELNNANDSTHSRTNDVLAAQLRENIEGAFAIISSEGRVPRGPDTRNNLGLAELAPPNP